MVIGGQNEEILTKVSGFVAGFSGFLLMKKKKVLLSRRSIPKQIKTLPH